MVAIKLRELDMLIAARRRNKIAVYPDMLNRLNPFLISGKQFVTDAKAAIEQYRIDLRAGLVKDTIYPGLGLYTYFNSPTGTSGAAGTPASGTGCKGSRVLFTFQQNHALAPGC